ncbi:Spo0E family sporulation regulatory protein-aspartic acid phosphatase [Candidatus Contubernalis alkaliaceticus]|uniref:Spo0E family sporulation regulatory protein-aspartic acid phosphatase n=1 Tax=Candidatus Contubernalis alkaliaceticus TaxID=338645 RepID=UPI001F4C275E|nr:Spo0E family sporulation regulatory protein-aspartic acid phosphatase [Candidatus Contubernalis alkalaceticus]UNC93159.1 Spo0E family sporulation regulatory protein-aspartic acid phosphatase [Candidatus Contubernalis alkalaceticus]
MKIEDKIETARCILIGAANMNVKKEILLKISEKMDNYILEYYRHTENSKKESNE